MGANVRNGSIERYVQNPAAAQAFVERHTHEERCLSNAASREDETEVSDSQASVETLLKQPKWAACINKLAKRHSFPSRAFATRFRRPSDSLCRSTRRRR